MANPTKTLRFGDESFVVAGLAPEDPYFQGLRDDCEAAAHRLFRQVVRDGDVCLDVGANIGLLSLMLARRTPAGRVLSIEAGQHVARLLQANLAANGAANATVLRCAAGDRDGEAGFHESSAYGYLRPDAPPVTVRRLETLLREQGLARADLLKLDIEGGEFAVLRDSLALVERSRALVTLEYNVFCQLAYSGTNPLEFAEWLCSHFSHVHLLQAEGERCLRRLPEGRFPGESRGTRLFHDATVGGGTVDLVVTNAPERLPPECR